MMKNHIDKILSEITDLIIEEIRSHRNMDMKRQNKIFDQYHHKFQEILATGHEGRRAVETLLSHELPMVRCVAASYVRDWNPQATVPVLEELLSWSCRAREHARGRPAEAGVIAMECEVMLAEHYGIALKDVLPRVPGIRENDRPWM